MSKPNPAPRLSIVPEDSPKPNPYMGRIISLELADGSVLELQVRNVCNMSVLAKEVPENGITRYDGLGNVISQTHFEKWGNGQ